MFQTPTTDNNLGGNYSFTEDSGVSNVVFTGVKDSNDDLVISETDVNKNQLPRGGMIVSLGSTQGLGVAPLVGASVTAFVSGGVIQSIGAGATDILGSGYRGSVAIESLIQIILVTLLLSQLLLVLVDLLHLT